MYVFNKIKMAHFIFNPASVNADIKTLMIVRKYKNTKPSMQNTLIRETKSQNVIRLLPALFWVMVLFTIKSPVHASVSASILTWKLVCEMGFPSICRHWLIASCHVMGLLLHSAKSAVNNFSVRNGKLRRKTSYKVKHKFIFDAFEHYYFNGQYINGSQ